MLLCRCTRTLLLLSFAGAIALLVGSVLRGPVAWSWGSVTLGGHVAPVGWYVDVPAALLLTLVTGVGALVAAFSVRHLAGEPAQGRFALAVLGAVTATALVVTSASLPGLVLFWVLSGVAVSAVVGARGDRPARRAAATVRRTFLAGDLALVAGLVVLVVGAPTGTSLARADLPDLVQQTPAAAVVLGAALAAIAGLVRSAQLPVHRWLPETAAAATPASALLHAGVVNGAGVLAVLWWPLYASAGAVLVAVGLLGALTAAVAGTAMRGRADVKGRFAASTSAQMGYLSLQVGLGLPGAALLHAVGHGAYKASLFLGSGEVVGRSVADRDRPAPLRVDGGRRAVALAGSTAAAVLVAAAVSLVLPPVHAPASWLLVAAAAATSAVLTSRLVVADRRVGRRRWAMAVVPLLALAGYLLTVGLLERRVLDGLAPSSLPSVWQWALAGAAAAVGAAAWVVDREVRRGRLPRVRAWAVRSALPPARARRAVGTATPVGHPPVAAADRARARVVAGRAASTVVPTWPLDAFVATNPLGGLDTLTPAQAFARMSAMRGTRSHLDDDVARRWWREGRISPAAVVEARAAAGPAAERATDVSADVRAWWTAGDLVDELAGTDVVRRADEETAVWCAAVYDRGEAAWGAPATGGLWSTWRVLGARGAARGLGVRGFRRWAAALPSRPDEAIVVLLAQAGYPLERWEQVLSRTANRLPGWMSHARLRAEQGGDDALELLAVRLAAEVALVRAAVAPDGVAAAVAREVAEFVAAPPASAPTGLADVDAEALVWQRALEETRRRPLLDAVAVAARDVGVTEVRAGGSAGTAPAPAAQVVWCIDVRSERLRRHLEAVGSGRWETLGFAGFFGVPFRHLAPEAAAGSDQCPVLLRPRNALASVAVPGHEREFAAAVRARRRAHAAGDAVHAAAEHAVSPFVLAEVAGYGLGVVSGLRTAAPRWWADRRRSPAAPTQVRVAGDGTDHAGDLVAGFTVTEQVFLAEAALRTMGLTSGFAPLLVLTGHGATTTNNPFDTGYACGACGGNGGIVNARALAAMLNDRAVRDGLRGRGLDLPAATVVVAGLHDTTLDTVEIDEVTPAAGTAEVRAVLAALRADLAAAGGRASVERARMLPGAPSSARQDPRRATAHVARRAADWSEVRPEWGLVGNYAFVAGPRSLTAAADLEGRVFLHSYDPAADPDGTALEVILTAPVVVAQWINAQYLACAIDPDGFGSGSKVVHNVTGRIGVVSGARGDLRPALPLQGVADATGELRHEPLRLMVVVAARPETVDTIVARHDLLQRLLGNGWITLVTVSPDDRRLRRWDGQGVWHDEPVAPAVPARSAGDAAVRVPAAVAR